MALYKERSIVLFDPIIVNGVIANSQGVPAKQQEGFIKASIETETSLNENIDNLLDNYRNEVSPFLVGDLPYNPGNSNQAIETTTVEVKKLLQAITSALVPIGNAAVKVIMLDAIKKGLPILQESAIKQDILMRRVLGGKEQ